MQSKLLSARLRAVFFALAAMLAAFCPKDALAIEHYTGTVVGECVTGATTNVTATVTAPNWYVTGLNYTFTPSNGGAPIVLTGTSGLDPNSGNKIAHFTLPPGNYTVTVDNGALQGSYTITVPNCSPQFGTLSISKSIVNNTGQPTSGITFAVNVNCQPGPQVSVILNSADMYHVTLQHIAAGTHCAIAEIPPPAPAGCSWTTAYPHGQTITISSSFSAILGVQNTLVCRCPPGTMEQTYPGSDVKYCCDHPDPHTGSFCCKREVLIPYPLPMPREDEQKTTVPSDQKSDPK